MKLLEEITPCLNNIYILIPNTTSAPIIACNCNPGSCRWQSNHLCPNCLGLRAVLSQDPCLSPLLHWIPGPLPSLCVSTAHTSDCSSSGVLQPAFWIVLCLPLTDLRHLCNSTTTPPWFRGLSQLVGWILISLLVFQSMFPTTSYIFLRISAQTLTFKSLKLNF